MLRPSKGVVTGDVLVEEHVPYNQHQQLNRSRDENQVQLDRLCDFLDSFIKYRFATVLSGHSTPHRWHVEPRTCAQNLAAVHGGVD
jgi:hypothetical protein